ncbi:MAG: rnpA [Verrucomicrobia bacterium]|nr:rnpA [Verrucomicrobiota bacterium]
MRFRPEQHLRRQDDFRAVREKGRRIDCGAFTLWVLLPRSDDQPPKPRVGVVASIASVGGAVQRTRAKRRLRALFREHQALVTPGADLLLVARAAVNRLEFRALEQKFIDACHKIFPSSHAPAQ